MFCMNTITKNGLELIELKNKNSLTTVEILPKFGGILQAFTIQANSTFINVIDGHNTITDCTTALEINGFKSCKLSPFVCRINNATYTFNKQQYTIQKFLLGPNALHGLLYNVPFTIISQQSNDTQASIALQHTYTGSDSGYPFAFTCTITYTLYTNDELKINTVITNNHTLPIPIQDGWHPYFTLGKNINTLQLQFNSDKQFVFDGNMIPTGQAKPFTTFTTATKIGEATFDDCFTLKFTNGQSIITLADDEQKIKVNIIADKSYPYLQIYTPPHRQSIAIENLSSPPDGFNNGIDVIVLPPLAQHQFTTTYQVLQY